MTLKTKLKIISHFETGYRATGTPRSAAGTGVDDIWVLFIKKTNNSQPSATALSIQ
jgi:hypothetical protein